jgi:hypothetical protein
MPILAVLIPLLLTIGAAPASAQTCLHGPAEAPAQKIRRDAALQLATRINLAQTIVVGPGPQRRYRSLDELTNIPPTPEGFDLQFHTDGARYSFSIKDRVDPCRYVVFSDQEKYVYEAVTRPGQALVVPLGTN